MHPIITETLMTWLPHIGLNRSIAFIGGRLAFIPCGACGEADEVIVVQD